jgi:hypothetical protein
MLQITFHSAGAADQAGALANGRGLPAPGCGKARAADDGEDCHGERAGQWKGAAERAPEISKDDAIAQIRLVEIGLKVQVNERNDVALYLLFQPPRQEGPALPCSGAGQDE